MMLRMVMEMMPGRRASGLAGRGREGFVVVVVVIVVVVVEEEEDWQISEEELKEVQAKIKEFGRSGVGRSLTPLTFNVLASTLEAVDVGKDGGSDANKYGGSDVTALSSDDQFTPTEDLRGHGLENGGVPLLPASAASSTPLISGFIDNNNHNDNHNNHKHIHDHHHHIHENHEHEHDVHHDHHRHHDHHHEDHEHETHNFKTHDVDHSESHDHVHHPLHHGHHHGHHFGKLVMAPEAEAEVEGEAEE